MEKRSKYFEEDLEIDHKLVRIIGKLEDDSLSTTAWDSSGKEIFLTEKQFHEAVFLFEKKIYSE